MARDTTNSIGFSTYFTLFPHSKPNWTATLISIFFWFSSFLSFFTDACKPCRSNSVSRKLGGDDGDVCDTLQPCWTNLRADGKHLISAVLAAALPPLPCPDNDTPSHSALLHPAPSRSIQPINNSIISVFPISLDFVPLIYLLISAQWSNRTLQHYANLFVAKTPFSGDQPMWIVEKVVIFETLLSGQCTWLLIGGNIFCGSVKHELERRTVLLLFGAFFFIGCTFLFLSCPSLLRLRKSMKPIDRYDQPRPTNTHVLSANKWTRSQIKTNILKHELKFLQLSWHLTPFYTCSLVQ